MNQLAARFGIPLTGNGRLTLDTLEKWLNPEDTSRPIPLRALPVFCAVLRDHSALDALVRPLGLRVIGQEEARKPQWADAQLKIREYRQIATETAKQILGRR
jgi:hypothetical protein